MNESSLAAPALSQTARRANVRLLLSHPAHLVALGFGSGLSPIAPGTVGTLWAWMAFLVLHQHLSTPYMAGLLAASFFVGWWACTVTLVLWLVMPSGPLAQAVAFALFRYFDAAKPGPVAWADRVFKGRPGQPIGWAQGFGIIFDDLVAALCTLLVFAGWRWLWP